MKQVRLLIWKTLTVALLASALAASQQTTSKDTPRPAANAWMLTPTPYPTWNPDIPASVRGARDKAFDSSSFRRVPLTDPTPEAMGVNTGQDLDLSGDESEIVDVPNRAILTAAFTNHRSVLSASELSLYTEVTLHVDTVFEDRTGSGHPFANQDITLLLSGGTVALRSGRTVSDDTAPRELFLQPSHKYLLVLTYRSEGDFYLNVDDWDISDGTVRANTYRSQYFAKKDASSSLHGLPVLQLGSALGSKLLVSK
jgi:hypothetical protein